MLACSNVKPQKTIYASLSPLFRDFISKWPKAWKDNLGMRRLNDLGEFKSKKNQVFFVGSLEPEFFVEAANKLKSRSDNIFILKNVPHDISHPDYMKAVIQELKNS